jgi:hypothetical protein
MARSFRQDIGRIAQRVSRLFGLDQAMPLRTLQEGFSPYLMNVRVRTGHIEPAKFAGDRYHTGIDPIYGSGQFRHALNYLILLGNTKAYSTPGGPASLHEITPSPAFQSQSRPRWQCFSMMSSGIPTLVVNNGGSDRPHMLTDPTTQLEVIGSAYRCKCVHGYTSQLFCGAIYDGEWLLNRMHWSDEQDITSWTGVSTGFLDLEDEADVIQRMVTLSGGNLGVFRAESIYVGFPNNDIIKPLTMQKYYGRGLYAPGTLQDVEGNWVFVSAKDIFVFNGSSLESIGTPIRHEFFKLIDPNYLEYAWSFVDRVCQEYYIVAELKDGSQRAWIYNYYDKCWTQQDMSEITHLISWYEA